MAKKTKVVVKKRGSTVQKKVSTVDTNKESSISSVKTTEQTTDIDDGFLNLDLNLDDNPQSSLINRPSAKRVTSEQGANNTKRSNRSKALDKKATEKISLEEFDQRSREVLGTDDPNSMRSNSFREGIRTLKDCLSPDSITVVDERTLQVGGKYVRNYVLQGYPQQVYVTWLNTLYSYPGDLDILIYIEPEDANQAATELTKQITQLTAQLQHDVEKGIITNTSKYSNEIASLEAERAKIEMNAGSFFKTEVFVNLFANTQDELRKSSSKLENDMRGQRITLMPTALRMLDGFRSAFPAMMPYYEDKFRNLNIGAAGAFFPLYNASIYQEGGVMIGVNESTGTPMCINMYDRHKVVNTNMSIFGRAGSGKSYFVSLLTLRSALQNIHSVIIDPEGEYGKIARAVGGLNIVIAPGSQACINVFDVEKARNVDDDGNLTGEEYVDIDGKVSDLVSLFGIMSKGELTQDQTSLLSTIIQELYAHFGITKDPNSLFEQGDSDYDAATGRFYNMGRRKKMPTLSDFHDLLVQEINDRPNQYKGLQAFANTLLMFRREGAFGLFDCESTVNADEFNNYPIINFDVHSLEENVLRPIGMYVALTYTWEKIIKRNFEVRKRVVCDEAWMLMKKSMAGSTYTRKFLETCSRRIRKRNAGLLVASQNFIEFSNNEEGKSVLSNTAVRIFLKQSPTDIEAIQAEFKLSDGEIDFLRAADVGEFLIKTDTETAAGYSRAMPYEDKLIKQKNSGVA